MTPLQRAWCPKTAAWGLLVQRVMKLLKLQPWWKLHQSEQQQQLRQWLMWVIRSLVAIQPVVRLR